MNRGWWIGVAVAAVISVAVVFTFHLNDAGAAILGLSLGFFCPTIGSVVDS
jgi:hypothetical protein